MNQKVKDTFICCGMFIFLMEEMARVGAALNPA
jgi:hypothetical protein